MPTVPTQTSTAVSYDTPVRQGYWNKQKDDIANILTWITAVNTSWLVPTGAVMPFAASSSLPSGWLACDGSAVSRTTYADLYAVCGTTFGAGDGSTTFNLPDLRGEFIRGYDNGRGVDSGRTFGTTQADALASHTHQTAQPLQTWDYGSSQAGLLGSTNVQSRYFNSGSTGGSETRPKNVALLYIIKY